jgi:hypothetical protein
MTTDAAVQEREQPAAEQPAGTQLAPRPEAPLTRTGAMSFGLGPATIDEAWRLAGLLAKSKLVPKDYRNEPEDILVAMLLGNDVGLSPTSALSSIAVINGKAGLYGDGFLGVIQSKPAYQKHVEYYELADGTRVKSLPQDAYTNDETKAVSIFWRKGNPDPFTQEFSIGAAKRAKLWGKQGPWSDYPARQLMWRARSFAGRDGFAAELRGIKMVEELLDTPDDIVDQAPAPATNYAPPEPVRRSAKMPSHLTQEAPAAAADGLTPAQSAGFTAPPDNQVQPEPPTSNGAQKPAGAGKTAAAAAEAKLEDFKQVGPGQVLKNVRITNTAMVVDNAKQGGGTRYEIQGDTAAAGKPGATQTWVTHDEQLYRAAASCEGTDSRFSVTWHTAKTKDGKKEFKVITGLEGN